MAENRPITFNTLRELLPFVVILVTIALAWGALGTQQALTNQKLDNIIAQETHFNDQLGMIQVNSNDQAKDIAVIKEILQHNNLSRLSTPSIPSDIAALPVDTSTPQNSSAQIASLSPQATPAPTPPASTVVNTFFLEPTPSPQPENPTPVPTPTPEQKPILCLPEIVSLCI